MKIIAHRGDCESNPENTLIAFTEAIRKGAHAIELDIHISKDDQLIVHHDYSLEKPSHGKGYICDVTSAYIKTLDAGSWFNNRFADERIPLLTEVFETFDKKINYEIELKGFTQKFIHKVLNLVAKHDLLSHIEFTSPHAYILSYLKKLSPQAKIGMFASQIPPWMDHRLWERIEINTALLGNAKVLHLPPTMISDEFVASVHKNNLFVHAANCDTWEEIDHVTKMGVDQLSTNMLNLLSHADNQKRRQNL